MARQSTLEGGNASMYLVGDHDPFRDGCTTGSLELYGERHRPSFPLTSQVIADHLLAIVQEPATPSLWKAGRITGWRRLWRIPHKPSGVPCQRNG